MANKQYIHSTHTAELPIDGLPKAAQTVHLFPELGHSLLAIAPLCDHGCQVTFTKHSCAITLPNGNQLHCPRNTDGLWVMPTTAMNINRQPAHDDRHMMAAPVINQPSNTPADLVAFAHAALFSPALTTLPQSIKQRISPTIHGPNRHHLTKVCSLLGGHSHGPFGCATKTIPKAPKTTPSNHKTWTQTSFHRRREITPEPTPVT